MKNGECPKCKEEKPLTNHHVYPKRHYPGQFTNEKFLLRICRPCHDDLEKMIPHGKQEHSFYANVVKKFLGFVIFVGILYSLFK